MRRLTFTVPDEMHDALRARAREERISIAELVRRSLRSAIEAGRRRELMERALSITGKYHSGLTDVAERHDHYLAQDTGEDLRGNRR